MRKKDILLITNYFPPEKGAAANRMHSLAAALSNNNYSVTIVCPLPNYPNGKIQTAYKGSFYSKSVEHGMSISRLWIWPSNSKNTFLRLLSMFSFSISLHFYFLFKKIPKVVVVQYSPIFIGVTAVFWARILNKRIVLNVSDLWPKAGLEMGLLKRGFYYSVLEKMEYFCYRKSNLILGQSEEILTHIGKLYPAKDTFLYRNFPNFNSSSLTYEDASRSITIVYAGLLGVAQGIYAICTQIKFPKGVTLHIYGAGPEAEAIGKLKNPEIVFHGEIDRAKLHQEITKYDIGFIPLVNRIYGSVPSKIFEYTKLGLPILYYAGGEGEGLVTDYKLGWSIPVNNINFLQQFIDELSKEKLNEFPKDMVKKKADLLFDFHKQFKMFNTKIESL